MKPKILIAVWVIAILICLACFMSLPSFDMKPVSAKATGPVEGSNPARYKIYADDGTSQLVAAPAWNHIQVGQQLSGPWNP
jgi:hypothetical protein